MRAGQKQRQKLRLGPLEKQISFEIAAAPVKTPLSLRLQPSDAGNLEVAGDLKAAASLLKSLSAGARKQIRKGYPLGASAVTIRKAGVAITIPEPGGRGKPHSSLQVGFLRPPDPQRHLITTPLLIIITVA